MLTESAFIIGDPQAKPGQRLDHVAAMARLCLEKKPDLVVCVGDLRDHLTCSRWESDKTKAYEARDLLADIEAGNEWLEAFEEPIRQWNRTQNNRNRYRPRKVLLWGNHDRRLDDYLDENRHLASLFPESLFAEHRLGWEIPGRPRDRQPGEDTGFLEPWDWRGVRFAHYFAVGPKGDVTNSKNGCPSAWEQAKRLGMSSVCGHKQGAQYAIFPRIDRRDHALILGSSYQYHQAYKSKQGSAYFRGCALLHDVEDGDFDLELISLRRLLRRYGS